MIEQVITETLQEKVYAVIRDSITKNDLLPGQPLSIDKLAQDLGVSPTPVREALARLSADGLVERTQNKTALVAKISIDDVRQVYEVRKLVEPYAASLVAKKLSMNPTLEESLHELKEKARGLQEILVTTRSLASSQYEAYLRLDLQLQEVILEALGASLLGNILSLVGNHSLRIRSFVEASSNSSSRMLLIINKEHLRIFNALLDGDPGKVGEVMQEHLNNAEARTVQALTKGDLS